MHDVVMRDGGEWRGAVAKLVCWVGFGCVALGCATGGGAASGDAASGEGAGTFQSPFSDGHLGDEELSGAHMCCEGEIDQDRRGCLGEGHLIASTGAANGCLAGGGALLTCGTKSGGWMCLAATENARQLCQCEGTAGGFGTVIGMDNHTWDKRIGEVYQAHRSEDAEPHLLCCDELDAETGECRWSYEQPAATMGQGHSGPPPRGYLRDDRRGRCEAEGGKVTSCPIREIECDSEESVFEQDGRKSIRVTGACTCATGFAAD